MNSILEWLLGLEGIRFGSGQNVHLTWDPPGGGWVLWGLAVAALVWITHVYRRQVSRARSADHWGKTESRRGWSACLRRQAQRTLLVIIRCALVALVLIVLARPKLVLPRDRIEPSCVILAVDTSLSMAVTDRTACLRRQAERSRLDLARAVLTRDGGRPLRELLERHSIGLFTFADTAQRRGFVPCSGRPVSQAVLRDLVDSIQAFRADGPSTDLAGSLSQILHDMQGRRLAAVILLSDGQPTQPTPLDSCLTEARNRHVPVLPIRLGSPEPPKDVEVKEVRTEENVFVSDLFTVEASIAAFGLTGPTPVTVSLVDRESGAAAASKSVTLKPGQPRLSVELSAKAKHAGAAGYRVEVSPLVGESTTGNNARDFTITVREAPLRVLYVEGYPRYEYRYLKNALLREPTIELSVLLLSADDEFVQEGTDPIRRFPATAEELERFDVVLFGDVNPRDPSGWLSAVQMDLMLDFVRRSGGGFGLIAGTRAAPGSFAGTPLEPLLPVRSVAFGAPGGREGVARPGNRRGPHSSLKRREGAPFFAQRSVGDPFQPGTGAAGFRPRLTREGRRHRIFRFDSDPEASERRFNALPELYWFAPTLGPTPSAVVLAEHRSVPLRDRPMPLVVTGRYGAGRLFFQATDDTWRWRRETGELLHDTYWVHVVRTLARPLRLSLRQRFTLHTDRRVYPYGAPVQAEVEIFDPQWLAEQGDSLQVTVTSPLGSEQLSRNGFRLDRISAESNRFAGSWIPEGPGSFALKVAGLAAVRQAGREQAATRHIRVEPPNLEARHPEANPEVLARIAAATGGQTIEPEEWDALRNAIPDRSVRFQDDIVESLWDSKLVLLLFTLMISIEWVLRKRFGLL